jgi:hypothetical protein
MSGRAHKGISFRSAPRASVDPASESGDLSDFDGRIYPVEKDLDRQPGSTAPHLTILHDADLDPQAPVIKRVAMRAVVQRDSTLLLLRSRQSGYKFPGGGVGAGEELFAALARELQEECGVADLRVGSRFMTAVELTCAGGGLRLRDDLALLLLLHHQRRLDGASTAGCVRERPQAGSGVGRTRRRHRREPQSRGNILGSRALA